MANKPPVAILRQLLGAPGEKTRRIRLYRFRAPSQNISVGGAEKCPGCENWNILGFVAGYAFWMERGGLSTTTIRHLILLSVANFQV